MTTTGSAVGEMKNRDIQNALEYLLLSQLNLTNRDEAGQASNSRLTRLYFSLLQAIGAPAVFCDVGANEGSTGAAAKRLFPSCRVLSLEANPEIYQAHVDRRCSQGVEYRNLAASSKNGSVPIFVPRTIRFSTTVNGQLTTSTLEEPANTGRSSLLKRAEDATYEEFTVESTTLDSLLAETVAESAGRSVALWIDVEGAAYDVLMGAEAVLDRTSAIFIECESYRFWQGQVLGGDIARLLIAKGFLPLSRDREYSDSQFNIVFVHGSLVPLLLPSLFQINPRPPAA